MGGIGKAILDVLRRLYGSEFISKTIGTRANVVKPKELDTNAPTKNMYSPDAFRDPKLQGMIDEKIQEYAPFIFSNRNQRELMNYLDNAQKLLKQKKKDFGVTDQLESVKINPELLKMTDDKLNALAKEGEALQAKRILTGDDRERLKYINNLLEEAQKLPETGKGLAEDIKAAGGKPEADVIDIGTKKKVEGEGIMSLKEELGLPEGVDPKSERGKLLTELQRATAGSKRAEDLARQAASEMLGSTGKDVVQEGRRRAVVRQMLLNDKRLKLSKKEMDDLSGMKDLDERTGAKDPLELLDKYYERDIDRLDMLDNIIDEADNAETAAKTFLESENSLKLKEKDLGEKLKKADDDPDMPEMAKGGRIKSDGGLSNILGV